MSLYQVISFSLSTFLRLIHVTLETSSVNLQVLCFCAFAFCRSIPQWQTPRRPPPHIVTSSAAMGILTQTPWCPRVRSLHKGKALHHRLHVHAKHCIRYSECKSYRMGQVTPVLQTRRRGVEKFTRHTWGGRDTNASPRLLKPLLIPLATGHIQISFHLR